MSEITKDNCDFSCWLIKYDCESIHGLTYTKDCLKDSGDRIVPLLWNHKHFDEGAVLGKALLEHRDGGVYVYGYFDNSVQADLAKQLSRMGDIWVSPFVRDIRYDGKNIVYGFIGEVSLVFCRIDPDADYRVVVKETIDIYE